MSDVSGPLASGLLTELQDNSALLCSIMDNMTEAFLLLGRDFRIKAINRRGLEIDGRTKSAIIGRSLWEIWPGVVSTDLEAGYRHAMATSRPARYEHHYAHGHHNVWLLIRVVPATDGLAIFYEDISLQKVTEAENRRTLEELRESRELLRSAQEAGGVATWDWHVAEGIVHWSDAARPLLGIPQATCGIGTFLDRIHSDDVAVTKAAVCNAFAADTEPYTLEFRIQNACCCETYRWVAVRGQIGRDMDGRPVRVRGVIYDVTDRKLAEEALRASKAQFRAVLDTSIDGFMVFEAIRNHAGRIVDFRWTYANSASEPLLGKPPDWFIGRRLLEVFPGNKDEGLFDAYTQVVETGEPFTTEFSYKHDGLDAYLRVLAAKVEDGFAVSYADLTDRQRAQEVRMLLMREIDHRAKNVLAVVQALMRLTTADDIASFRERLEGRIASMAHVHSLLARGQWVGADMGAILQQELDLYADRFLIAGPAMRLEPQIAQPFSLTIHELATNAAKHGSLSVPQGRVVVEWAPVPDSTEVEVVWQEDGGPIVHKPEKLGFGSELMQLSIEDQAGGSVIFDWKPAGLICRIRVPASRSAPSAAPVSPGLRGPRNVGHRIASCAVLIVEDEPIVALHLQETLHTLGCRSVKRASRVKEALRLIAVDPPDIVFLDVNLAGECGVQVAKELENRGILYAWCTGYEDVPGGSRGAPVLRKPFKKVEILEAAHALISAI